MTSFNLAIAGHKPIAGDLELPETQPPVVGQFWRAPHDPERVRHDADNRYIPNSGLSIAKGIVREAVTSRHKSLPEVYRFEPFHNVILTSSLQWLWRNINPELSGDKWASLLWDNLMLCNGTGFGDRNGDRRDYVNNRNATAKDPAYDQVRFMGGAVFRGEDQGKYVAIETILVDQPLPTAKELLEEKTWLWYWATGIRPDGGINYIQRKGIDGTMKRVRIPLFTKQQVYLPKDELHKLPAGVPIPEPNWMFFYL